MRGTGGQGLRRLATALALTLLLLPILPVAPAQSPSDPWWGPSDRAQPTKGWAVRVPVIVENTLTYPTKDLFVAAQIDFGKLLVEAGWTNQSVGTETRLRGFTLDVDSIRVVEYHRGFVTGPLDGTQTRPTPHVFFPALLDAAKHRDFHAERNPAGTVMWQVPGPLQPQEKRYFYVYANPIEFGKTPPAAFELLDKSPLDAFLWGTRGVSAIGYEPHQEGQGRRLHVHPVDPGTTTVTVSTNELGRFVPLQSTSSLRNPATLQQYADHVVVLPANKAFKIEADKPVIVFGEGPGGPRESFGFVPGDSGSFADDAFKVAARRDDGGGVRFRIYKASPGVVTVNSMTRTGVVVDTQTLSTAEPWKIIDVACCELARIEGNGKFLVSMDFRAGETNPFPPHQIPALTGGPSGLDFFSFLRNDAGYFRICPEANLTLRVVDYDQGGTLQIFPEGVIPNVAPAKIPKAQMCHEEPVPKSTRVDHLFEFYSAVDERDPASTLVPFRLFVGSGTRLQPDPTNNVTREMVGHYGGLAGLDYYVYGNSGIIGHYNGTRITIFEEVERSGRTEVVNRTRGLSRDEFVILTPSADGTGRFRIVATKPIAVTSLAPAQYEVIDARSQPQNVPIPYGRYVPGRPLMANITLGAAEFRGPLVEIRSPETNDRQLFRSTGPGSPLSFRLDVVNLGRWVSRESLSDTISVTCTAPTGWAVEGCAKEFTLGTFSSERLNLVVTPPDDAKVNSKYNILVEARSKSGGVTATFKLIVYVEVRYGVAMWFDVEGGRKRIDPPIGLDPGETHRYRVLVKNTGSTLDTITLAPESPRDGWDQDLLLDNEPVTSLRLDGGATAVLQFVVKAPNAETAPQNIVRITAQSQTSALAADFLDTATRIRPKVDLEMTLDPQTRLAEPNESVRFNLTTRNKGNDVFTVLFRQDSILPKGWNATLSVDEITLNPNPGDDPNLSYVLGVTVTPPPDARAGDLASVKIAAEIDTGGAGGRVTGDEVSAVVVVRRVYSLVTPPVFDAEATPGDSLRYVLPITNHGNGQVEVALLSGAVTPDWPVTLDGDAFTLAVDETADLPLRIDVPRGTPAGLYNLTFTTRLSREALQNLSIPVNVRALSRVDYEGPETFGLTPGRSTSIAYTARNTGNVEAVFELTGDAPPGWTATVSPARARLAPGGTLGVLLTLNASREAVDGVVEVTLASQAEGAAATTRAIAVDVRRPQLSLQSVSGNGQLRSGELVLVTATVANAGGIEAENVSVALEVDGRVVDRVTLARIPVGSTALATLSWVATQRGGDVKVVLDPDEEIALPARGEATAADVEFGSRLGLPGPGVAALVLAIALAGRALGRAAWRERRR